MTTSIHEKLGATLEDDPGSLRSGQLMEGLFWKAIEQLETPQRVALAQLADSISVVARKLFNSAPREPSTWRVWYAGQMQGVAGLLRIMLSRQLALETTAALRGRKHVRPILARLAETESRVSDLAKVMGLDDSQLGREIKVLARHNLVETVKEGRERWVRITPAGKKALGEVITRAVTPAPGGEANSEILEMRSKGVRAHNSFAVKKLFPYSAAKYALEEQAELLEAVS